MSKLEYLQDRFAWLVSLFPERAFIIIPGKDGDYPSPFEKDSFAAPYVEILGDKYHYVSSERGHETIVEQTTNENEVIFWLSRDYTYWLATKYEVRHRIPTEDFRRQYMGLHVLLLKRVNIGWAEKIEKYYNNILLRSPFDDKGLVRTVDANSYSIVET